MTNLTPHLPKKLVTSCPSSRLARRADKEAARKRIQALKEEKLRREKIRLLESSLLEFSKGAWHVLEPSKPFVDNWHLHTLSGYLEAFFRKDIKRLILNVPPGSMKSLLFSVFGPAWVWTWAPGERFINMTNEVGLAGRDCTKMRLVIESDWYQERWGEKVRLIPGQNEKLLYTNTAMGFRQGLGITGNVTGKRGSFLLLDDPIDAKKAFSDVEIATVNDTFDQAVSSRLNDLEHDCIGLIMQRTRTNDLSGHLLKKSKTDWVVVSIPMEYEGQVLFDADKDLGRPDLNDPRTELRELMFPARFPRTVVESLKEDLGEYGTAGQLQQRPMPLGGGILKSAWWKPWPSNRPLPTRDDCDHVFVSWDTAFSEEDQKKNAYSAMTMWGVFWEEQRERYSLILLSAWDGQVEYHELRAKAKEIEETVKPDGHIIENKASGIQLIKDMRRAGISVIAYNPKGDKVARAYIMSSVLQSGQVWYVPEKKWVQRVVDFAAQFPRGAPPSADYTDTCTQAWLYLKNGWWLSGHPDDPEDEQPEELNEQRKLYG